MKISQKILLPFILLVPLVIACNVFNKIKEGLDSFNKPKILTAVDGSCQITVPGFWMSKKAEGLATVLEATNPADDVSLIIFRDPKIDHASDRTLPEYVEFVQQDLPNRIEEPTFTPPRADKIGSFEAQEFEVEGTVGRLRIRYLITLVSTPTDFFQIILWTSPSRFGQNKPAMRSIIVSFKEIPAGPGDIESDTSGLSDESPPPPATPVKIK